MLKNRIEPEPDVFYPERTLKAVGRIRGWLSKDNPFSGQECYPICSGLML